MKELDKRNPLHSNRNFFFQVKDVAVAMKMKPGMKQMILVALEAVVLTSQVCCCKYFLYSYYFFDISFIYVSKFQQHLPHVILLVTVITWLY